MTHNGQQNAGTTYQIEIQEQLDESWTEWFGDFELTYKTDDQGKTVTILTGIVIDQAALNGILTKLWNLNLTVLSVKRID
jgi:hypothetical protein